jgi:ABC-2 type transport system permease protein
VTDTPTPTPTARLVDRSLTHVGERRGVGRSMLAMGRHTLRRILGLRRPFRYKILPIVVAVIAYLPAVAFLALAALIPGQFAGEVLPTPGDFYGFILFAVILFTALSGPQSLCPDRRNRTLGLYLASPLDRTTYLVASGAALVAVLLVVTLGPPLLIQAGLAFLDVPGPAILVLLARVVGSGVVLSLLFGAVGLAGASLTDRRSFAAAGIFIALIGLTIVANVLIDALDLPEWTRMLDVAALGVTTAGRFHGTATGAFDGVGTPVLLLGVVLWVGALGALVQWRYRRLEVVR